MLTSIAPCAAVAEPPADEAKPAGAQPKTEDPDPRWLDRFDRDDRALLEANVGYAPPKLNDDLRWVNHDALQWSDLHGKVVVLQSWTSRNAAGRSVLDRLSEAKSEIDSDRVQFLAVHTPDGADVAEKYLERQPASAAVLIDPAGLFCDELGFYRRPANVIIDRTGAVRYAGIRLRFIPDAVKQLLDEPWDGKATAVSRPKPTISGDGEFPRCTNEIRHAKDVRGLKAPPLNPSQWVTARPDAEGKVVVIDFWATWCGWCIHFLPHTNELAAAYPDDVVVVGLSDETPQKFTTGMQKLKQSKDITVESFHYALALDPQASIKKAAEIRGIPHMIVLSSDWVVRWQGHPKDLDTQTLGQIVSANRKLTGSAGPDRYRWTGD